MIRFVPVILLLLACAPVMAEPGGVGDKANHTEIHREIKDILAQPEYNRFSDQDESALSKWWRKAGPKIVEFIQRIFRIPRDERGLGKFLSYTLAGLVILAFLVLLALIIRKVRGLGRSSIDEDAGLEFSTYGLPSPAPLMRQAAKLADSGDYRGAFLAAYLASISHLDEQKALRWERGRTNWEYLRELHRGGFEGHYNQLRPLTFDFDRKVYGHESCSVDDYTRAVDTYNAISSEAAV